MLIQNYQTNISKTPNNSKLTPLTEAPTTFKYKGLDYPSGPFDVFDSFLQHELESLFDEQYAAAEAEGRELTKYDLLSSRALSITLDQYEKNYFHTDGLVYNKHATLSYIQQRTRQQQAIVGINTIHEETRTAQKTTNSHFQISRSAIRDVTGFTFTPVPGWSENKEPVDLTWQREFMNATEDLVIVNGSRQIGKSFAISELLIEESYEGGGHIGVFAFAQDTTDAIREYVREKIDILNELQPQFVENKQKNFITNILSGTRIYFITLEGKGKRARGKTLRLAVVDEAQEADEDAIEGALEPTMTTTKGRIYLLGTPGPERAAYMYQKILEINRNREYNNPGQMSARVINVDVTRNPLINPKRREYIMQNSSKPNIQREYFCAWGAGQDKLFDPKIIQRPTSLPNASNDYLIIGIDPARKNDRSAYAMNLSGNSSMEIITSGEVPESHKHDWNLQANFYKQLIDSFHQSYKNIYVVMDITGVGDGVLQIFRNKGIRVDMPIRYVAGDSESDSYDGTRVGKQRLINYTLDAIHAEYLKVVATTNAKLIAELETIEARLSRNNQIKMESHSFDDITNAMMLSVYFSTRRSLFTRNMRASSQDQAPMTQAEFFTVESKAYGLAQKQTYTQPGSFW